MNPSLQVDIGADISNLRAEMQKAQGLISGFGSALKNIDDSVKGLRGEMKKAESSFSGFSSSIKAIGASLVAGFSISSLSNFGKEVINITAEFQKFEAVLTNTLGSNSAAQNSLKDISEFAAKTPFSVAELTGSFVKLANQGFVPTTEELRKLGDLASSTGKSFDQLAEAVLDAQTGQFERLKEFGVKASKAGDQITFSFKGVQTQTKFTNDAIKDYLLSLGDVNGVSGAMASISGTLGGQISNLGDSWDSFMRTLGEGNKGALNDSVSLLDKALKIATDLVTTTEQRTASRVSAQAGAVLEAFKGGSATEQEELKEKIYKRILELQMAIGKVEQIQLKANQSIRTTDQQKLQEIKDAQKELSKVNMADLNNKKEQLQIAFTSLELIKNYTDQLEKQSKIHTDIKKTKAEDEKDSRIKFAQELDPTKNKRGESLGYYGIQGKSEVGMPDFNKIKEYIEKLRALSETAKPIILDLSQTVQGAFVGLGEAIGNALAGTDDFGSAMLKMLGSIMRQVGSAMIGLGTSFIALKFAFANPVTAGPALLAAGVGLVALASLISAAGKSASTGGGGGSTGGASRAVDNFKDYERIRATSFDGATLKITGLSGNTLSALMRRSDYQTGLTGG